MLHGFLRLHDAARGGAARAGLSYQWISPVVPTPSGTLSKLNAFDFVVTVALGSTLATILLASNVALAEGMTAFIVLIGMQYVVTRRGPLAPRCLALEPVHGDWIRPAAGPGLR